MADLAKYGEVQTIGTRHLNSLDDGVNELLAAGWHILTVKVVEEQYRVEDRVNDKNGYIRKEAKVVYCLGKLRESKK